MFSSFSTINKVFLILGSLGGLGACLASCLSLVQDEVKNEHFSKLERCCTILMCGASFGVLTDHLFPYHPLIIVLCSALAGLSSVFCRDNFLSTTLHTGGSLK